jgi:hypothetical protein
MTTTHLLIIVVPSFVAGVFFGRSLSTGAIWGIIAELMGLIMVAIPISAPNSVGVGPRGHMSAATIALSLLLGAAAGVLGFMCRRFFLSLRS